MHITRLRLLGFKSFVDPTELLVEGGLTGVVGPNGCGKSNLLEALRWVMGETSHKSMRAAAMDDVIFSGTTSRPARNAAEVTIFIDNSSRSAPAGFNDTDEIEITRRIEREAGSAYRINGREARARDVKVLFEDAATGARSPALVRQGQIAEIVNAKPDQRRRILEDAAGVAGLHTRRHEAELRLRAAEGNLARIGDILGQISSQVEALKRQARQAKRYKELSGEIRRMEALLFHLAWAQAQAEVTERERELEAVLGTLGLAVEAEARATRAEASGAEVLPGLRDEEAIRGAVLARLKVEQENFEREARRAADRQTELDGRIVQLEADLEREADVAAEARQILERLEAEQAEFTSTGEGATEAHDALLRQIADAQATLAAAERQHGELTARDFEQRTKRRTLEASLAERIAQADRLRRQFTQVEAQHRDAVARMPDASVHQIAQANLERLIGELAALEAQTPEAEAAARQSAENARERRQALEAARLEAGTLKAERDTLVKLLGAPSGGNYPPVVDQVSVEAGFERALGAALGDDLDAALTAAAPAHWLHLPPAKADPSLPAGCECLARRVDAPPELQRRLAQVGIVSREDGSQLQRALRPGQRLVSVEGDLWRWDGFVATAEAVGTAAQRLTERNRLAAVEKRLTTEQTRLAKATLLDQESEAARLQAEADERALRQAWRDAQIEMQKGRDSLAGLERAHREAVATLDRIGEAKGELEDAVTDAHEKVCEIEDQIAGLETQDDDGDALAAAQGRVGRARESLANLRAQLAALDREHQLRLQRAQATAAELARWRSRSASAGEHQRTLAARLAAARRDRDDNIVDPAALDGRRTQLMNAIAEAERARQGAADALAAAEGALRDAASALRAAHAAVGEHREARARIEARLEAARTRRTEEARKSREQLGIAPEDCPKVAGIVEGAVLPLLPDVDRDLTRLKADRERLGGVNLQAESELDVLQQQFSGLDRERADVEEAIAKLRGAIQQLNREGRRRLMDAFKIVDGHFQRLFTTLFGGGEARLEMIESEDPLEGGLEIIAKPPGKKPATLSLLSGGEQTLTALSLIFAVFLTNPSPICVLDEVDAPLDDSNVDRFCTLMEKMASETETRFLVITHHPMTMARMQRLFGVTMTERGVSQLVSVDLTTAESFREAV